MKLLTRLLYHQLQLSIEKERKQEKAEHKRSKMSEKSSDDASATNALTNNSFIGWTSTADNNRNLDSFAENIQTTLAQIEERLSQHKHEEDSYLDPNTEISTESLEAMIKILKLEKKLVKDYLCPKDLEFIETLEMFENLVQHMRVEKKSKLFYKLKKFINVILPSYRFQAENSTFKL